ncbi:Prepronociceptin [Nipponia nippon]|uniref:Prepronociceptin n=1 Tax=Nipponia nippon TaxID=128390 RepID=A0A091VA24_NIPNI|nr:Prepronociceptin [Nipponia nippon]
MRAVLWDLLLLCLFARARGDCRGDCLRCDRHLYRDSFDVLVSPSACWLVPHRGQHPWGSPASPPPPPLGAREWVLGGDTSPNEAREGLMSCRRSCARREAEDEGGEPVPNAFPQPPEDISRRLGGFPRGTRGSRPAPMARGVQKRYGGFIGVRKSARKWNNQKRFSEFLKQYLGMSPRSTFRHRIPAPSARHRQN